MKAIAKVGVIVLLVATVGVLLFFLLPRNDDQQETTPQATAPVEKKTISQEITGTGEVREGRTKKLRLNEDYKFKQRYVKKNEFVGAGEVILEYTNRRCLYAPYDAVITGFNLPEQDEQLTKEHFVQIKKTSTLKVEMDIYEEDLKSLRIGQNVSIVLNALQKKFKGKITNISELGKYSSNGSKFKVAAEFKNNGKVRIGMSARYKIVIKKVKNTLAVPIDAVYGAGNNKYVMVKKDGKTTRDVKIKTGISDHAYVAVTGSLKEGDLVVLKSGGNNERNGEKPLVQVITDNNE